MTEVIEAEVVEEETATVAALAKREESTDALVRPAADLAQVERAFKDYQQLTQRLLTDDDYQPIRQWNPRTKQQETKKFPKRSAWRKLAVAFGVTFEIVSRDKDRDDKGRIINADFVVRATAPNGRFSDGWGNCDRYERCCQQGCTKKHTHCPSDCDGVRHFSHAEHDIPATAETRAKNRAAADLFGMGQVSAEEIVGDGAPAESRLASDAPDEKPITDPQMKKIHVLLKKLEDEAPTHEGQLSWKAQLREMFKVRSAKNLTVTQAGQAIEWLEQTLADEKVPF